MYLGFNPAEVAYREAKMGAVVWAAHLPFFSISAQADLVETHLREDLPDCDYLRLNIELDSGKGDMDDVSDENIKYLESKADEIIDSPDFEKLIRILTS